MLTRIFVCDMIIVLGRLKDRPVFCYLGKRNNPWRIGSNRNVKGYLCSFLVSNICWLTSLSAGWTLVSGWQICLSLQEELSGGNLCLEDFTCTLVSPLCTFMIAPDPGFFKMGSSTRMDYVNHSKGRNSHLEQENHWLSMAAVIW